jgi:RNA polymerase subunit RPABC4/transcription elongation factor Spt4
MDPEGRGQVCSRCGGELASEHDYCRLCGEPSRANSYSNGNAEEWTCMTCGRKVSMDFKFCPNCGRPSIIPYNANPFPAQQPEYIEDSTAVHYILFALSFLVPLLGFILGFLLTRSHHSPEDQHAGRICMMLALFWPLIAILFIVRILLII